MKQKIELWVNVPTLVQVFVDEDDTTLFIREEMCEWHLTGPVETLEERLRAAFALPVRRGLDVIDVLEQTDLAKLDPDA